jgi:hypothetical protein
MWAMANPALGIRVTPEYIEMEQRALSARGFAVERLGVGDWPDTSDDEGKVISVESWMARTDEASELLDPVCFAFDVRPDRSAGAIGAAGRNADGKFHIEVIDHKAGTGWIASRIADLVSRHASIAVKCDESSPAASLLPDLKALGVDIDPVGAKEHAKACGVLFDAVDQETVCHLGTAELLAAIKGAAKRPLGDDAWAWSRKSSSVDISPLVACTLALFGSVGHSPGNVSFEWL